MCVLPCYHTVNYGKLDFAIDIEQLKSGVYIIHKRHFQDYTNLPSLFAFRFGMISCRTGKLEFEKGVYISTSIHQAQLTRLRTRSPHLREPENYVFYLMPSFCKIYSLEWLKANHNLFYQPQTMPNV